MKARLLYHHKAKVHGRYILELTIYKVGVSSRYKEGFKYRLVCVDIDSDNRVLFDNHHPKGHHIHINNKQRPYAFRTVDSLVTDFKITVYNHMGVTL
jgi:hypothetical protein